MFKKEQNREEKQKTAALLLSLFHCSIMTLNAQSNVFMFVFCFK